jgi:hypothetical protein
MRYLFVVLAVALAGCEKIDTVFGPPFESMSQEQIGAYCAKWPDDNMCKRWQAGEFRGTK